MDRGKGLTRWERRILGAFTERFSSSAHRRGGRRLRIGKWEVLFPEIRTDAGERTGFLEAMESCEGLGIIHVKWRKYRRGDDIEAAYLENDRLLYDLMGAEHPDDLLRRIVAATDGTGHSRISDEIIEYCDKTLAEKGMPPFEAPRDVADLIILLDHLEREEGRLPLRALSVKLYNNSKRIETLKVTSAGILKKINRHDALSSLDRSFPECGIRGDITVEFHDGRVWDLHGEAVSLSRESVCAIRRIIDRPGIERPILSVENKETFHLVDRPDLYCGYIFSHGHINEAVRAFMRKVVDSGMVLHHFGDMDPDGILIFLEIHALSNGACVPFMMDVDVYRRYLSFGYHLDASRLSRIPKDAGPLASLAEEIRKNGKGVEQEIIDTQEQERKASR